MEVGHTVRTPGGFVGEIIAMCGDGCARLRMNGGLHATYPMLVLSRIVTDAEKDRVYRAAMEVHRFQSETCLVYQLADARDELRDACKATL